MEGSKVSDAGAYIKNSIYDFINENENTVLVVDCENSDPYKFCAALRNLDREIIKKISRIILFDDVHTTDTWSILESYIRIPVEYLLIERIKQDKSLVDIRLTTRVCKEHWQNQVNAFVLVSSDSDYWGLISALPEADFLVMIEHTKCGPDMKSALEERGIFYCYLDDFYTGNSEDIKRDAILREMKRWADDRFHFNINEMLDSALYQTRINLSEEERRYFTERYLKTMTLNIDEEGELSLGFKSR